MRTRDPKPCAERGNKNQSSNYQTSVTREPSERG